MIEQDLTLIEDIPLETNLPQEPTFPERTIYFLQCEHCNGEYGEVGHRSAYESIKLAKEAHKELVDPKDLKGKDAINEWQEALDKGVLQFRTGCWGFVVWTIREISLYSTDNKLSEQSPSSTS